MRSPQSTTQNGRSVEVRSSDAIHDRYLFVDKSQCYFLGASFKDGVKDAPALLSQMVDAFQPMWDTYNAAWQSANVVRPA